MVVIKLALLLVAAFTTSSLQAAHARYHIVLEGHTWKEADQACRTLNMELVTIDSVKEMLILQNLLSISEVGLQSAWVGIHERNAQGHFLTSSGEELPDSPTEEPGECVALHPVHGLHAASCSRDSLATLCGSIKTNHPISVASNSLANLRSSISRVVRSVDCDCTMNRPRRKSRRRRRKQFRKSRRLRISRKKGALDGRMTGKITGSMEGYICGISRGNITGIANGVLHGTMTGVFEGNATGNMIGFMRGTLEGEEVNRWTEGYEMVDLNGRFSGELQGEASGFFIGVVDGVVVGNTTGGLDGGLVGTLIGNMTGRLIGHQEQYEINDDDYVGFLGPTVDFFGTEPVHSDANPLRKSRYILVDETTRNMTGEMWGDLAGDVDGSVDGVMEGERFEGEMNGMMNGTLKGNMTGTFSGVATGNITRLDTGEVKFEEDYLISEGEEVNLVGKLVGEATGSLEGSMVGELAGHLKGRFTGTVFGALNGELKGSMFGFMDGEVVELVETLVHTNEV